MSTAFRFLLHAREKLYSSGILPTRRLHHPVISVGNLTLGGTGKTPLVIALAQGLRARGFHPVILSRGYGRISRGVVVKVPLPLGEGRVRVQWEEIGDEPYLMMNRLGNVPIVVNADRYEAGLVAEKQNLGDLFLLDDAFQHRRLHRDIDIVTIDPVEWAAGETLLPTGRWREPKGAIARAHIACIQEITGAIIPALPIPSFIVRTEIQGIYKPSPRPLPEGEGTPGPLLLGEGTPGPLLLGEGTPGPLLLGEGLVPLESLKGRAVVAFAGIAKPERFFSALESLGIHPIKQVRFPDHHHYSPREVEKLGGEILITTEKDAVRLMGRGIAGFLYLRISAKIPDFERLMLTILDRLPKP